ncbi:hypothetical protein U5801_11890 [Lamprobacter modestohalophilus]|uniref:hypothetical protein n=1 Tax=Lamprobacter modestohalophilus TaxID=1064514 RepID=UPI002ADEF279|nr:hypothetical protein [Lamprobacter modestohalophilus]MEA1050506.1 hypothetical protein [Lamprobacter modestohalophilus]
MTEHTEIQETEMIAIELLDDDRPERFDGTPAEIVEAMNNTAFAPMPDATAYMERYAHYANLVEGHAVRTSTASLFLTDIIACGLARIAPRAS